MKNILAPLLFGLLLNISSCTTASCPDDKQVFLVNFFALVQEAGELKPDAGEIAWSEKEAEFQRMVEECYPQLEEKMDRRDKYSFWSRATLFYYHRHGEQVIQVLADGVTDLDRLVKSEIDKRWERTDLALDEALLGKQKNWKNVRERMKNKK